MSRDEQMNEQQEMGQQNSVTTKKKHWPKNCPWPEPLAYSYDYDEEMVWSGYDDETQELLDIKKYFDSLVASGRLNEYIYRPENRSCTESEPHPCRFRTAVPKCINITQHISQHRACPVHQHRTDPHHSIIRTCERFS